MDVTVDHTAKSVIHPVLMDGMGPTVETNATSTVEFRTDVTRTRGSVGEGAKLGGKATVAIQNATRVCSDRIAATYVATVLKTGNVTTSMAPVLMGVMKAIKEVTVHKFAITIHMDRIVQ